MHASKQFVIILFLGFFCLTEQAQAGVLVEPYLGFSIAGDGESTISTVNYDFSYSSVTYGGRLGYSFLGLMGGLDYSMQSFKADVDAGGTETKKDVDKSQLGLFVGYDFPILLRAWATYFLSAKADFTDYEFKSGGGYALGVGFTGLPFVSINLEYRDLEYDKFEWATTHTYDKKASLSEILLSVSAPFDF